MSRPPPARAWRRMVTRPRANRQPRAEPMLENTRDVLRIFYTEYNEQLAVLLGDVRYLEWHESDRGVTNGDLPSEARPPPPPQELTGWRDARALGVVG